MSRRSNKGATYLVLFLLLLASTSSLRILKGLRQALYFNSPFRFRRNMSTTSSNLYPTSVTSFGPLDDVVMGGSSSSSFDAKGGKWEGNIVTQNGGFAGIRSLNFNLDASAYKGFVLKVRGGGGQRFKFITRDSGDWNGVAWTWEFDTSSKPSATVVRLPFSHARPTKFAKTVPGAVLDKEKLTTIQFTLSKFAFDGDLNPKFNGDGPFSLNIDEVALYS
ncbi:hypothetical protein TrRE_jg11167 [Triparma retinervis]|uniref:NADH:ubiquinone oxidoreductase intermediate-associated protein 30 domain-containing protein n=1 Tax=Triparma retinervis TaxID=2557542 RepID=A0A9W6ZSQ6_9STRA|nr:hypothetical protein TrRE_jg11167 [Triparma retinervis]